MNQPIDIFETEEDLIKCGLWWQDLLGLSEWNITFRLVHPKMMDNKEAEGETIFNYVYKLAEIKIVNLDNNSVYYNYKYCAELTLVHELLHCIMTYDSVYDETKTLTFEEAKYAEEQHAILERMAKSLIMAKYDIALDYFKLA